MRFNWLILVLCLLYAMSSCAVNTKVKTEASGNLDGIKDIMILEVGVIEETISTGSMTFPEYSDVKRNLSSQALNVLNNGNMNITANTFAFSQMDIKKKNLLLYKLSRGIVDPAAKADITGMGTDDNTAVLCLSIYSKYGEPGTWNPNSGAITSNASNTTLRAAIIQCNNCQILWLSEVFYRAAFSAKSRSFENAVTDLFSSLNTQTKSDTGD